MSIVTTIILGLCITFIIIYITINIDKFKPKKRSEHQDLIDSIHAKIAKANGASMKQYSLENLSIENTKKQDFYAKVEFVNKNCTNLEDFIINDEINEFDLLKLADLNGIDLQIRSGWFPLVIELIKKLNAYGWNKKVTCIKEKYAGLRFHAECVYGDAFSNIVEKYENKSQNVCETCGEPGEIRSNSGWDYVACRKHYLENRGKITIVERGFNLNDNFFPWKDIKNANFEDLMGRDKYNFLNIQFNNQIVRHAGWEDRKLYISKYVMGFGNFLNHLPKSINNLDYSYIENFKNLEYCKICGYQAVYFDECECCENETWNSYIKTWRVKNEEMEEKKLSHHHYKQLKWAMHKDDVFESTQNNYPKNPNHKILYTEKELKEHLESFES